MEKSKIYTKTGDTGHTSLVGGKRVSKTDIRLDAYGTVDELNSQIGELVSLLIDEPTEDTDLLLFIQNKLFVIGSYLATDVTFTELKDASYLSSEDIEKIEKRIDGIDSVLPPLQNFILPGGALAASKAHVCRTVCRRAERRICEVAEQYEVEDSVFRFINRLSDYLFILSRFINLQAGKEEIYWDKNCN